MKEGLVEDQPKVFLRIKQDCIFVLVLCNFVTLQLRVAFYTNDYTGELIESTLLDMYLCIQAFHTSNI